MHLCSHGTRFAARPAAAPLVNGKGSLNVNQDLQVVLVRLIV